MNLAGIFQWNYGSESLSRVSSGENGKRGSEGGCRDNRGTMQQMSPQQKAMVSP